MEQILASHPAHLRHDAAVAGATHAVGVVSRRLPPERLKEVFDEFYRVIDATIEAYDEQKRLHGVGV